MSTDTYPKMETAEIESALEYFLKQQVLVSQDFDKWLSRCERNKQRLEILGVRIQRRKQQKLRSRREQVVHLPTYHSNAKAIEELESSRLREVQRRLETAETQMESLKKKLAGVEDRIFRARRELAKRGKVLSFQSSSSSDNQAPRLCDYSQNVEASPHL